ncbi:MAG: signal recognition particle-docking protein FtsY [Deltaproteobacteria bacterium]|uniref:Signal recognition particle receptor FtsY n=1 Tax=Candidatus Zymogenus saltonus TaxID=2844893 RepID=A0A9D8K8V6_9DELT|nr:signal recognition particle-docking protein FtsY [Candidatus Zymogenus saltonus]
MSKGSFVSRLAKGLSGTRKRFAEGVDLLTAEHEKLSDDTFDKIEEILLTSDIGVKLTETIIDDISGWAKKNKPTKSGLIEELNSLLLLILDGSEGELIESAKPPTVVLVVGVNGTGKTTTIAKIANRLLSEGKSVLLAAGDTFRDAAIEQLILWGEKVGVQVISQDRGSDPASVAFDALERAKAKEVDYIFVDTAGRLHTKYNLMEELKKIKRVLQKGVPDAPHETLLVLDASIGQNNIVQARKFSEEIGITGIALTKLDGTAKGGAIFPLFDELKIPIKYVGVGEGVDDLDRFEPDKFVAALLSED